VARAHFIPVLFGVVVTGLTPALDAQSGGSRTQGSSGVPARYAGNWVCQTFMPGYNLIVPGSDPTRPVTTPSTVTILKFSVSTDGTYETSAAAKGHYSFDSRTKTLTWLDGPHETTMTKTELGERDNGEPTMGLTFNKRYYGCFMPKPKP
jgi:hypothetical protein